MVKARRVQFSIDVSGQENVIRVLERLNVLIAKPQIVGGSLDGATMPAGTRHGQTLTWDADRRRWIDLIND